MIMKIIIKNVVICVKKSSINSNKKSVKYRTYLYGSKYTLVLILYKLYK